MDSALGALIVVWFAALGFTSITAARGRLALCTVPEDIPSGGRLTYRRPRTSLPQRSHERFETSVTVVGL